METGVTRMGDVVATQKRGEPFTEAIHANSAVALPERGAEKTLGERHGHEEWKQRTAADWEHHLESLQRCVCELLLKNQQLRMALVATREPERGFRDGIRG